MKIKAELVPGKVAVVTGGSSGIGKAIACELAERGMHVWLLARRQDVLESARAEVEAHRQSPGQVISTVSADVAKLDEVRAAIKIVADRSGVPDLLVNSAGVTQPGYVENLDMQLFNWMMDVNYFGTVYITKEVLPAMIERGSGYILNISSYSGIVSSFGYTAYGASKFAVHGFSEALRMEVKPHGIGVSIIFPTDTDTPQLAYENQYKPPETKALNSTAGMNSPQRIARRALKGIERGQYFILVNFESRLYIWLKAFSLGFLNFAIDQIVANAAKKKNTFNKKEA